MWYRPRVSNSVAALCAPAAGVDPDIAAVLALSPGMLYWRTKSPGTINRDGTGATAANGDLVGRIPDLSGNNRYAEAANDGQRAALTSTGWNYTGDIYTINSALSRSSTQTMILRMTRASNGLNQAPFSTTNYDIYWFTDDIIYTVVGGVEEAAASASVGAIDNTLTIIRNGTTTVLRRNGTQIASISGATVTGTYNRFGISTAMTGELRFMAVFPTALAGADLTAMEAYAAT